MSGFHVRSFPTDLHEDPSGQLTYRTLMAGDPAAMGRLSSYAMFLGAGRSPHEMNSYPEEEIIVPAIGTLDSSLGHTTDAPAIIYYRAGTPHGLAPTDIAIDMLAFEFHPPKALRTS